MLSFCGILDIKKIVQCNQLGPLTSAKASVAESVGMA